MRKNNIFFHFSIIVTIFLISGTNLCSPKLVSHAQANNQQDTLTVLQIIPSDQYEYQSWDVYFGDKGYNVSYVGVDGLLTWRRKSIANIIDEDLESATIIILENSLPKPMELIEKILYQAKKGKIVFLPFMSLFSFFQEENSELSYGYNPYQSLLGVKEYHGISKDYRNIVFDEETDFLDGWLTAIHPYPWVLEQSAKYFNLTVTDNENYFQEGIWVLGTFDYVGNEFQNFEIPRQHYFIGKNVTQHWDRYLNRGERKYIHFNLTSIEDLKLEFQFWSQTSPGSNITILINERPLTTISPQMRGYWRLYNTTIPSNLLKIGENVLEITSEGAEGIWDVLRLKKISSLKTNIIKYGRINGTQIPYLLVASYGDGYVVWKNSYKPVIGPILDSHGRMRNPFPPINFALMLHLLKKLDLGYVQLWYWPNAFKSGYAERIDDWTAENNKGKQIKGLASDALKNITKYSYIKWLLAITQQYCGGTPINEDKDHSRILKEFQEQDKIAITTHGYTHHEYEYSEYDEAIENYLKSRTEFSETFGFYPIVEVAAGVSGGWNPEAAADAGFLALSYGEIGGGLFALPIFSAKGNKLWSVMFPGDIEYSNSRIYFKWFGFAHFLHHWPAEVVYDSDNDGVDDSFKEPLILSSNWRIRKLRELYGDNYIWFTDYEEYVRWLEGRSNVFMIVSKTDYGYRVTLENNNNHIIYGLTLRVNGHIERAAMNGSELSYWENIYIKENNNELNSALNILNGDSLLVLPPIDPLSKINVEIQTIDYYDYNLKVDRQLQEGNIYQIPKVISETRNSLSLRIECLNPALVRFTLPSNKYLKEVLINKSLTLGKIEQSNGERTLQIEVPPPKANLTIILSDSPPDIIPPIVAIQVKDSNGKPVTQATIYLDGRGKGKTDKEGNLVIDNVPFGKHELKIIYEGQVTFEVDVNQDLMNLLIMLPSEESTSTQNITMAAVSIIIAAISIIAIFLIVKRKRLIKEH